MKMSANFFGIIAIVISVGSLFFSYRVSTSDYQVAQEAKVDITTLLSAAHNIMYKCALLMASKDGEIDISSEQKVVQNFLLSPTRSGFNKLVYEKEKVALAHKKETREVPWRIFLLALNQIVDSDSIMKKPVNVDLLLISTKNVIDLFSSMKKNDIQIVLSEMKNLDNLVRNQKRYVEEDIILSVVKDLAQGIVEKEIFGKNR